MSFSFQRKLDRFTMDSIWNCAFGLDINCQYDDSKYVSFYHKSRGVFKDLAEYTFPMYVASEYLKRF